MAYFKFKNFDFTEVEKKAKTKVVKDLKEKLDPYLRPLYDALMDMIHPRKIAEYLEDELERIKEISKAEIRGVDDKEVKIKVDPYKLEAVQLNFGDVENAIEKNILPRL